MPYLLLARHGESEYNAKNLWAGWADTPLTEKGHHQAVMMAGAIKDLRPDVAYTSLLSRTKDTLEIILQHNGWDNIPTISHVALNERNYGDFTGMNKSEAEKSMGKAKFDKLHRGWDDAVPGGESLRMVYERVVLYFNEAILPEIKHGKSVLVVSHGNALRALIKHLDGLSDEAVEKLEMPLVEIVVYDYELRIASKQVRQFQTALPFVTVNSTYIK
jgi:2,3-bisphosphoglycerate-dependent phosphoglycerate mutase